VSQHQEWARELIDLVADAIDAHDDRQKQYEAARAIVLSYHAMHPHRQFAFRQASVYMARRLELESV
jgi:hypothetical protein